MMNLGNLEWLLSEEIVIRDGGRKKIDLSIPYFDQKKIKFPYESILIIMGCFETELKVDYTYRSLIKEINEFINERIDSKDHYGVYSIICMIEDSEKDSN